MRYFVLLLFLLPTMIQTNAQVSDQKIIDSIFRDLRAIRKSIDNTDSFVILMANLKKLRLNDSISMQSKVNDINVLNKQVAELEKEKKDLMTTIAEAQNNLKKFNAEQARLAEKQIEVLLNERFDNTGNLLLSKSLISSILSFAQQLSPKNLPQLNAYLEIYDSIVLVRKIFEEPYSKQLARQATERIEKIRALAKQKLPNNKTISSELSNLQDLVNDYCKKTSDLFSSFSRIYPLSKTNISPNGDPDSFFIRQLDEQFFLAYKYKYLLEMINKYFQDPAFREQFKNQQPFTCN